MSPVLDQQLAGFLAKLCTIAVLWTVAFSLMMRSHAAAGVGEDPEPLLWSDVEREIQRADRRAQRTRRPLIRFATGCPVARRPYRPKIGARPVTRRHVEPPRMERGERDDRSGQRGSPELVERQLSGLIATALRALLDVAP